MEIQQRQQQQQKQQKQPEASPVHVMKKILSSLDKGNGQEHGLTFVEPPEDELKAYDMEAIRAIRNKDVETLRSLHESGKRFNASNKFGESLLHMACRGGHLPTIEFLLQEADVRTDVCDDYGRTIWHDAFWTPYPNHEVVDYLLEHANPLWLVCKDKRGGTPFDYARKDHWPEWADFLAQRREKILTRASAVLQTNNSNRSQ